MQGVAARICFVGAVKGMPPPEDKLFGGGGGVREGAEGKADTGRGGRTRAELKPRPTAKKADAPRGEERTTRGAEGGDEGNF